MKHKVSFVIISRNEDPSVVAATIHGLLATSHGFWREIIVVDDASTEPFSFSHPEVIVMRNAEPIGACRSRRRGCRAACGDVLTAMDAHMSFAPGWLEEMLKYVDSNALLTPPWMDYRHTTTYCWGSRFGWKGTRDNHTGTPLGLTYNGLDRGSDAPCFDIPMVLGACYMMRADALERIGGWNPHYSIYGSEEQDISARSWLIGAGVKCVAGARVGHLDRDKQGTPYTIEWNHFEQNQAIMFKTLFEPATTQLLEEYLAPLPVAVEKALRGLDLEGWRSFVQSRRRMSDAEFFARFVPEAPLLFEDGKVRLKPGETPNGPIHRAALAEEERLWKERTKAPFTPPPSRAVARVRRPRPVIPRQRGPEPMPPGLAEIEWKAGLTVKAFDLTVGFRANTEDGLDRIAPALARDWRPTPARRVDLLYSLVAEGGNYRLYAGNGVCGEPAEAAFLPELAAASLRAECVERVTDRVFVDAAVVGYKGRALMLLGNRWSGRSALLVHLLREGATYYSHAFAPLDARGRVHPFAQPLAFRRQEDEPLREWDLGSLPCGTKPLPVTLVALPTLRPSEKWAPTELTPAVTFGRLFGQASNARRLGSRAFRTLRRTVTDVVALEGHRDDARATARALLERLRKSA